MREIRQSGSEGGGNEQTVSPYPYLSFFFCIFAFNRGRERRFVRIPLPPNRTGGSPASGSPVDGFTPKGIDEQFHGRLTD